MPSREHVYKALDTERDYQNEVWQDQTAPGEPNPLSIGEFVLLLEQYVAYARAEWAQELKPELATLNIVRKIGGVAVHCMEQHGAPIRLEQGKLKGRK